MCVSMGGGAKCFTVIVNTLAGVGYRRICLNLMVVSIGPITTLVTAALLEVRVILPVVSALFVTAIISLNDSNPFTPLVPFNEIFSEVS